MAHEHEMAAAEVLAFIAKRRVKLQPVLNKNGKLLWWAAGYVSVAGNKWTNIVCNGQSAHGTTPTAAVEALSHIKRSQ